jgi:hypothetical protein
MNVVKATIMDMDIYTKADAALVMGRWSATEEKTGGGFVGASIASRRERRIKECCLMASRPHFAFGLFE